ncbi:MAG: hypothetical protein ACI4QM_05495, partial [Alphaproteobacteria bacterium]
MGLTKRQNALTNGLVFCLFVALLLVLSGCQSSVTPANEQEWVSNVQNCWPCVLYRSVFITIERVIMLTYPFLAKWALALMGVGLLMWLAFKTGRMLTFLYEPDIREYVHSVSVALFKAMVVAAVLWSSSHFLCALNIIISPILELFAIVSRVILSANATFSNGLSLPDTWVTNSSDALAQMQYIPVGDGSCTLFSDNVAYQLQDIVFRVYVALNSGMSLGGYFLSMIDRNIFNGLIGLFIIWMFFLMSLMFPWMFAESFIRLGAVLVLSPFVFACWVFPATSKVVKQAWNVAFGSMVQMLIGCIYIGLLVGVLMVFIENNFPGMAGGSRQMADPVMAAQIQRLSTEAVSFFALIIIMVKMQKNIPTIAGYFGGDAQKSEMVALFGGIKQLVISAVMIAVGAALAAFGIPGGKEMLQAGTRRVKEQAKAAVQEATSNIMDTGAGGGSGSADATGGNSFGNSDGGKKNENTDENADKKEDEDKGKSDKNDKQGKEDEQPDSQKQKD